MKCAHLAEKLEKGSISNLSTKVHAGRAGPELDGREAPVAAEPRREVGQGRRGVRDLADVGDLVDLARAQRAEVEAQPRELPGVEEGARLWWHQL